MTPSGNGFEDSTPRETRLKYIAPGRGRRPSIYPRRPILPPSEDRNVSSRGQFLPPPSPSSRSPTSGCGRYSATVVRRSEIGEKVCERDLSLGIACGFRIVLTGGTWVET